MIQTAKEGDIMIRGIDNYPTAYQFANQPQKRAVSEEPTEKPAVQDKIEFSTDALERGEQSRVQSAALASLQEKFPKMTFSVGTGLAGKNARNSGDNANRRAFTLDPKPSPSTYRSSATLNAQRRLPRAFQTLSA